MKPLHLHADITPRAMPRPRAKAGQRAYYPATYQRWRENLMWLLKQSKGRRRSPTGPVAIDITFTNTSIDLTIQPTDAQRKALRGDIDNYIKAVMDTLQDAGILEDDRDVHEIHARFTIDD